MAPPAADVDVESNVPIHVKKSVGAQPIKTATSSRLDGPLEYSGTLDSYDHFDVTKVIGREFTNLQLSEILHDDAKIRDLAILSKRRSIALNMITGLTIRSITTRCRVFSKPRYQH